jgi:curved DNA-binding protein CbpA
VAGRAYTRLVESDPFTVLGLPARPEVGDDEVRTAWRRIAAATHPDRADGGDPARFAAAAAAYTTLRTRSGRGEALADLAARRPRAGVPRPGVPGRRLLGLARLPDRVRRGRPARLALRLAVVAAVSAAAVAVAGWTPATPALIIGVLTWLLLTARHDLAPPP